MSDENYVFIFGDDHDDAPPFYPCGMTYDHQLIHGEQSNATYESDNSTATNPVSTYTQDIFLYIAEDVHIQPCIVEPPPVCAATAQPVIIPTKLDPPVPNTIIIHEKKKKVTPPLQKEVHMFALGRHANKKFIEQWLLAHAKKK